ncbi:MAG: gliding motility-associated protein GldM [Flavobacteriaceae bacterium]|jgi:gliding motility-associated protein GldM
MAGAKETPRQRMIGMMYIVLTAMLALNVSKSILDAFVAIEENIQKANLTELFRGDERKLELREAAVDDTNPVKAKKAKLLTETVSEIDAMTQERIEMIDNLKLEILEACSEDIATVSEEDAIIIEKYDASNNALKPIRMNLQHVEGKDKYDEPMYIMIGEDLKRPTGKGMDLWKSYNKFRKELTEIIASTQIGGGDSPKFSKEYYFEAPEINSYKTQAELRNKIQAAMNKSKVHEDDQSMVMEIYSALTKEEYSTVNDISDVHWIGKTFDHAPSVAAIASLSSLQKDILAARADALSLIRSRVGGADYSFNKLMAIAHGPEVVNQGEDFELEVMMVAYDSDNKPEVSMNGDKIESIQGGKGIISLKGTGGKMKLNGTVSIRNRAGIKKEMKWEKNVMVMKPSGSIELPELNVLYRGYANKVNATASGFPNTILTGEGVSLTRSGDFHIATPTGTGRVAYLTVSGKSSSGRTVSLKRVKYRVLTLPNPTMYWGGAKDGERASKRELNIFAKYGNDIPLRADFKVLSWELSVQGAARSVKGTGNNISAAKDLLNATPSGKAVTYVIWVLDPAGVRRKITAVFTI